MIKHVPSPRLKWMRENNIEAQFFSFDSMPPKTGWQAWKTGKATKSSRDETTGFGDTEDEAIVELAENLNIKLWNE